LERSAGGAHLSARHSGAGKLWLSYIGDPAGGKLIRGIAENGFRFTQQFDPFTGKPSLVHAQTHQPVEAGGDEPIQDAYGPTTLAALEYIAHRFGIHPHLGQVWFSLGSGTAYAYEAEFYAHRYAIRSDGKRAEITVNDQPAGAFSCGRRIIADRAGRILEAVRIEDGKDGER
jgi:hypothetical protein